MINRENDRDVAREGAQQQNKGFQPHSRNFLESYNKKDDSNQVNTQHHTRYLVVNYGWFYTELMDVID